MGQNRDLLHETFGLETFPVPPLLAYAMLNNIPCTTPLAQTDVLRELCDGCLTLQLLVHLHILNE